MTEPPGNTCSLLPGIRKMSQMTHLFLEDPNGRDSLAALAPTCSGYDVIPPLLPSSPLTSPQGSAPQCDLPPMTTAPRKMETRRRAAGERAVERPLWGAGSVGAGHRARQGALLRGRGWGRTKEGERRTWVRMDGGRVVSKWVYGWIAVCCETRLLPSSSLSLSFPHRAPGHSPTSLSPASNSAPSLLPPPLSPPTPHSSTH